MKKFKPTKFKIIFSVYILFLVVSSILLLSISNKKTPETRSKAAGLPVPAGNTISVCPDGGSGCSFIGGDGIQQAVDSAQNGDTILLQPGRYTRRNPTDDPKIKYRYCMVNTRGKSLTIKGPGALLDGENGGINYGVPDDKATNAIGICDDSGTITIDSLQIKQTLRQAIYLQKTKSVIKNVSFLDIDSGTVEIVEGNSLIINNLFAGSAGSAIYVRNQGAAKIENNTIVNSGSAGITIEECPNKASKAEIKNNLIADPGSGEGISIGCNGQKQGETNIISNNNFVWKGKPGDCVSPDNPKAFEDCLSLEECTGVTVTYPDFIGADEKGTVCIWGEGRSQGDFNTRPDSPVTKAGAGYGNGPCGNPASPDCISYIEQQKSQFQPTAIPTETIPTNPPYLSPPPDNIPTNPPYNLPTKKPSDGGGPPITYYLPPTMGFTNPNQPSPPTQDQPITETITPTITPTPKPLIDFRKSIAGVKSSWDSMVSSLIQFTKTVLP